jgi:hypothetical protein
MVQGPCAHLQLNETSAVVLDRLNVIIDRPNVISSSSVAYMKIDAKICFQGHHLAAIFKNPVHVFLLDVPMIKIWS